MLDSARSLLFWVSTSAFAALMLIGPFGLTVMRGVLSRLKRITVYMSELAKQPMIEAVPSRDDRDELGDMLFVLANLARKLKLDPEACLRHANDKFCRRFNAMEAGFAAEAKTLPELTLDAMEAGWQRVKASERD